MKRKEYSHIILFIYNDYIHYVSEYFRQLIKLMKFEIQLINEIFL